KPTYFLKEIKKTHPELRINYNIKVKDTREKPFVLADKKLGKKAKKKNDRKRNKS
ncbi:hypothetical protein LCGC14_2567480, partial [marine sediment metagenome]